MFRRVVLEFRDRGLYENFFLNLTGRTSGFVPEASGSQNAQGIEAEIPQSLRSKREELERKARFAAFCGLAAILLRKNRRSPPRPAANAPNINSISGLINFFRGVFFAGVMYFPKFPREAVN
jgi:hypothetical protein